ncbi:MAG: cation-transporting P-type ATPase [Clostridia bacterium]|nr:cation-transporting P-type ATPase [Clostridia bacterium]
MAEKWYNIPPAECAEKLGADLENGLDEKTARARLNKYGKNNVFITPGASFASCAKAVGSDISFYLLAALAVLAKIYNESVSAMVILSLIIINLLLTLFAYTKTQKILRNMSSYAAPMSRVLRGGKQIVIRQSSVVVGDIVLVRAGDIVPADCRVAASNGLKVLDNVSSDDNKSRSKNAKTVYGANVPPAERENMVFAASMVTAGAAKLIVVACGDDTLAAITGKRREIVPHDDLKVLKTLRKTSLIWGLAMMALILVISTVDIIMGLESRGLYNIFTTGAAIACAAMTEFYVIFAYFIIGVGLFGTMKKNGPVNTGAVIKNITTLEEIRDIDTLIVPKMGGFYTDRSTVQYIYATDTLRKANEKNLYESCSRTLKFGLLSSGYAADPSVFKDTSSEPSAIVACAERIGIDRMVLKADYPLLCSADSFYGVKADCAIVADDDGYLAAARGEAVPLLERCAYYMDGDMRTSIDERERKHINYALRTIDEDNCRAVAVISKRTDETDIEKVGSGGWTLEGLIGIREPALAGAEQNVRACLDAGIQIIVLTDGEQDPSRVYFKRLGLIEDDSEIITAGEIDGMDTEEIKKNLGKYKMYEGLTSRQKRALIKLLQEGGRVVGVLGRKLNDVLLLSDADVGFATGVTLTERTRSLEVDARATRGELADIGGSETLKYTCDVLVSPPENDRGGFNAMVKSLCAAKLIYQNIMRMVKYLFVSQIARLVVVIYSVVVHNVWPVFEGTEFLTPVQIVFLGLIVDLGVVAAIAFQRAPDDILTQRENTEERLSKPFMLNFFRTFAYGLIWGLAAIAAPLALSLSGVEHSGAQLTSLIFISFIITELLVACEILKERPLFVFRGRRINRPIALMWAAAVIFIALGVFIKPIGSRFGLSMLTPLEWLCALSVPALMMALYEIYKAIKK